MTVADQQALLSIRARALETYEQSQLSIEEARRRAAAERHERDLADWREVVTRVLEVTPVQAAEIIAPDNMDGSFQLDGLHFSITDTAIKTLRVFVSFFNGASASWHNISGLKALGFLLSRDGFKAADPKQYGECGLPVSEKGME